MKKVIFIIMLNFLYSSENLKYLCFDLCLNCIDGKYTSGKVLFQGRIPCKETEKNNILDKKYYYKVYYKIKDGLPVKLNSYLTFSDKLIETVYLNENFQAKKVVIYNKSDKEVCIYKYNIINKNIPKEILKLKTIASQIKNYKIYNSFIKKCGNTKVLNIFLRNEKYLKTVKIYYLNSKLVKIEIYSGIKKTYKFTYDKKGNLLNKKVIKPIDNILPVRIPELDDYPFLDNNKSIKKYDERLNRDIGI